MPKTILVTGCAGFVGSNFVYQFAKQFPKTNIIGIDDFSTGRRENVVKSIVFYEGSILDKKLLESIFIKHRPEYIFHFAALPRVSFSVQFPIETSEVNITGTICLLHLSSKYKAKRFMFSSSSSVYGGAKILPTKESQNLPNPQSPYALQKYVGEKYCKMFSELYGLDTVCLRYFNVYGPGQYGDSAYSTVISAWLESIYFPNNKKAFLEGDGKQSRDFCYVDNVVLANILAMKAKEPLRGQEINVSHGERTSVKKVLELIEKYTKKKIDLEKRPDRIGDVRHTNGDISKARKLLGYKPIIKFEQGLKKTIEWFESRVK